MSGLQVDISGNPIAYLDRLGKFSKLALIEQSSKAGDTARKSIRAEFDKQTTEWAKEYRDGKLVAFKQQSKLGMRLSHSKQNKANPENMKFAIQSMTHMTTGTTVVMGAFKGHRPVKIENGEVVGYEDYQSTVTRKSIAILEKLNSGKKSSTYMKSFKKGTVKGQFGGKQKYKNRRWAEAGFAKAEADIKKEMTIRLVAMIANFELKKGQTA